MLARNPRSTPNVAEPRSFELHTSDAQRVAECVARQFGDFQLTPLARAHDARLRHEQLGPVSFACVSYGNPVELESSHAPDRLLLHWPVAGCFDAWLKPRFHRVTPDAAHIIRPDERFQVRSSPDCHFLVMSIEFAALADLRRTLEGEDSSLPGSWPALVPMTGAGACFARSMAFVYDESRRSDGLLGTEGGATVAGQMLITSLLLAIDGGAPSRRVQPGFMRRAEEFLLANLAEPIGIADVVASAQVSLRSLHQGFHERHGVGPMAWLRQRRLERIHAELVTASHNETSVAEIATRWGVTHLGRFSVRYRARFGESPSQTLRRR